MLTNQFKGLLTIASEDFGEFDGFTGGGWDATEVKHTPFDGVERTYVTTPTTANVTASRTYEQARDGALARRRKELQGAAFTFVVLDKDASGNYQQNREPYTGLVKAITAPDGDSSGSDVAMITIELSTGTPGT